MPEERSSKKRSSRSRAREGFNPLNIGDWLKRMPFYPFLITGLVSVGSYLGCDPKEVEQNVEQAVDAAVVGQLPNNMSGMLSGNPANAPGTTPGMPVSTTRPSSIPTTPTTAMPQRTATTLIIGSFNMQRLGPTKLKDQWVMEHYADIIRRFDVLALEEVTSSDQNTLPALLQHVNANGARYSYTLSPPVGRTPKYLEQYTFVFDTTRVSSRQEACFLMRDDEDLLHREPWVARFATVANIPNPFTFVLINIHTDPNEVASELKTLAQVYTNVSNYFYHVGPGEYPEDDVMLLGDLNADPSKFQNNLSLLPNVIPTINGIPTNYCRTKTNDNLLLNRATTGEFTGRSGALDLGYLYSISTDEAHKISDHQPIWAEFSIYETSGNQMATQQPQGYTR